MATETWAIIVVFFCSFIGAVGQYFFKKASAKLAINVKGFIENKYIYYGVLVYAFGTIIWLLVLPHGELSVLYPFIAVVYVWVAVISQKFFKEKMNLWKWLGILSIVLGVAAVGLGA
jgi:undecaprenyl phosphate-alpha-L-ara4N flippase subunit ArnE